jgi:hypothetical protein
LLPREMVPLRELELRAFLLQELVAYYGESYVGGFDYRRHAHICSLDSRLE